MNKTPLFYIERVAKLLLSIGIFCFFCLCRILRRLSGKSLSAQCVVLYYHSIPFEKRRQFARQMDTVVRLAKAIPADGKIPLEAGKHYAVVTFDDAFESVLRNALPELEKRKIPATVFVISDLIGRAPGWEGYPERTMTLDELKQLPADLVTFGSHTMMHPALPLLTEPEAKAELAQSRIKLENLLNRKITLFSFPYGAFQQCMMEWCREAGYERVFTTLPYLAFSDPQEFITGRVSVEPDDWGLEFRLKLLGAYRWLPFASALKQRFFSMHEM